MNEPRLPFRIFGIPIEIKLTFLLVAYVGSYDALRGPIYQVEWILVLLVSVLWHELGHAVAFKKFGLEPRIELYAFGGITQVNETTTPLSTRRSLIISFAGPGAGLLLGGLAYLLTLTEWWQPSSVLAKVAMSDFLFVNITWSLVNLLPFLPLDGGHITVALFQKWRGDRGVYYGLIFSLVMALATAYYAYTRDYGFGVIMALAFAMDNGRRVFLQRDFLDVSPFKEKYSEFYRPYSEQKWAEAESAAEAFLKENAPEKWKDGAAIGLCYSRLKQGKGEAAWEALQLIPPDRVTADTLLQVENLFFEVGQDDPARKIAELRYHKTGNAGAAYNVACAHARLGQPDQAIEWLRKAVRDGFDDKRQINEDPDLASLRSLPQWQEFQ